MIEVSKQSQNKSDADIVSILNAILKEDKFKDSAYAKYTFDFGITIMSTQVGPRPMIIIKPLMAATNKKYEVIFPMPMTAEAPLLPILFTIIHNMVTKVNNPIKPKMTKKGLDEAYDIIYGKLDDIIRVITISNPKAVMEKNAIEKDMKATYIRFCLGPDKILNTVFKTIRDIEMEEENNPSSIIEIFKK